MAIEKNEAGWGRTRAMRRRDIDDVMAKVRAVCEHPEAPDRIRGVMFVGLEVVMEGGKQTPCMTQAAVCYGGKRGIEVFAIAIDEVLERLGRGMQAAEVARRESIVRGKKNGGG